MASARIVYYRQKTYKDKTHPVILQAIARKKVKRKVLFSVTPDHWNEDLLEVRSSHSEHVRLNLIIHNNLTAARSYILERLSMNLPIDLEGILNNPGDGSLKAAFNLHIEDLLDQHKHSSARRYENVRDKCDDFREDSSLKQIDIHWMRGFHRYLMKHESINSDGTIYRYVKFLKTVLRNAARRGEFNDLQVLSYKVKTGEADRVSLTQEDVTKLEKLVLPEELISVVRDAFILQIHLRGIRIGDLLQLQRSNIIDDRLRYRAQKTGKFFDLKLTEKAGEIIQKYPGTYIIPILKMPPADPKQDRAYQKHISVMTAVVNKYLKILAGMAEIQKKLTSHVARHTFAHLADLKGVSLVNIQQMLGHSSASQTDTYLKSLRKSSMLDDEAGRIFD